MIELISVEIENFRSFTSSTFSPATLGSGLTAITGENGSGKSSILYAIIWAMYGVTPEGVNVKDLRKQGSTGPVIAHVILQYNNQTISIERSLRGKNDSTIAKITLDGTEQTEISSRTATAWIIKQLGLDAEAFTSAFVVQQKELDSLVKARPAERRKTIERLAGIERMSKAVEKARVETKEKSLIFNSTSQPQRSIEEIQTNMKQIEILTNRLLSDETIVEKSLDKTKRDLEYNENYLKALDDIIAKRNTMFNELKIITAELENIRKQISTAENIITESTENGVFKSTTKVEDELETAAEELAELEKTYSIIQRLQERIDDKKHNIDTAKSYVEKKNNAIFQIVNELEQLSASLSKIDILSIQQKDNEANEKKQNIKTDIIQLETKMLALAKAIKNMKESISPETNSGNCPTCFNKIANFDVLLSQFSSDYEEKKSTLEKKKYDYEEISQTIQTFYSILEKANDIKKTIDVKENKKESMKADLTDKESSLNAFLDDFETLAEELHQHEKKYPDLTNSIFLHKNNLKRLNESLRKAENAEEAIAQKNILEENMNLIIIEVDKIKSQITEIETDPLYNVESRKNIEDTIYNLKATLNEQNNDLMNKQYLMKDYVLKSDNLLRELNATKNQLDILNQRKLEAETAMATAVALDAFRKDRVARLAPELSEMSSDLLSVITEGKYVAVEFDDDFTPHLIADNGDIRPVTWLSGGEESLVALALRIAIGEVLSGGDKGLLILDEVLTAQDPTRRTATMAAIRKLGRQTIIVNHIAENNDIVDKVINIIQDDDGKGSVITEVFVE